MVSSYDASTESVKHRPVNACLAPLLSVEVEKAMLADQISREPFG